MNPVTVFGMAIVRAQVTIPRDTNVAEDVSTNVFHFSTTNVLSATTEAIATGLVNFWAAAGPGGENALNAYLSVLTNPAVSRIKMWNLDDPKPRVPIYDQAKNLGPGGGTALPSEVALVGSYQANPQSGIPQNRRRGRFFLGPLSHLALESGNLSGRPHASLIGAMNRSMQNLASLSEAAVDWDWIVYSAGARDNSGANKDLPYKDRPLLPPVFADVTNGWVDNAFDTQRSRGEQATTRSLWT